jgi:hypothetical protein
MNKEFVNYEEALALKELGFDEPCFGYYNIKDNNLKLFSNELVDASCNSDLKYDDFKHCTAPLYQQAFKFFREKYGLWQTVLQNTDVDWTYDILPINGIHDYKLIDVFETYEEAELACLNKLIEIVKKK